MGIQTDIQTDKNSIQTDNQTDKNNPTPIVIGDIGGHPHYLHNQTQQLNPNQPYHIIQIGDLTRARPQYINTNQQLTETIQHYTNQPNITWTQLLGNHEAYTLGTQGDPAWPPVKTSYNQATVNKIREWYETGFIKPAHSTNNTLYTHAGMTRGYWEKIGRPTTAREAADLINQDTQNLIQNNHCHGGPGYLQTRKKINLSTSPLWATWTELVLSWQTPQTPSHPQFKQVVGHDNPYNWTLKQWRIPNPHNINIQLDQYNQTTVTTVNGATITCVDRTYGDSCPYCT